MTVSAHDQAISQPNALIRYDAACRAVADCKSVDEAKHIRNYAEALRAYAKQAKNRELEVDAAEIRLRAERRVGELVAAQRASVGLAKGQLYRGSDMDPRDTRPTLAEVLGPDHKHLADRARKLAAVPQDQFEGLLADWRERVQQHTERVTTNLIRLGEREQTRVERKVRPLPVGEYRLLYADPPWRYEHVVSESRAIENQYPTMSLDELCALRVPAAPDAVLYLWATSPKLAEAIRVIDAWGFSYRTCAVWDKQRLGMGYYFRQQHELLLVAAVGNAPVPEPGNRPASIIQTPRGKHSEKPEVVYTLLESMYPGFTERDRIELFARGARQGWTSWSNEPALTQA